VALNNDPFMKLFDKLMSVVADLDYKKINAKRPLF